MADKRIQKPQHIRQIIGEQINGLRKSEFPDKSEIDKARAIGYLSSVALTAMKDGELEERITAIEKSLKGE
ncbi:MAG: hypothetical protein ACQEV0_16020 [Bacillota bacterium]